LAEATLFRLPLVWQELNAIAPNKKPKARTSETALFFMNYQSVKFEGKARFVYGNFK
jgi:hypothetical protein